MTQVPAPWPWPTGAKAVFHAKNLAAQCETQGVKSGRNGGFRDGTKHKSLTLHELRQFVGEELIYALGFHGQNPPTVFAHSLSGYSRTRRLSAPESKVSCTLYREQSGPVK